MTTRIIGMKNGKPPCLCARFSPVGQRSLLHPNASVVLGSFSGTWAELIAQIEQIGGQAQDVAVFNDSMNEIGDLRAVEICVPGEWVTANGVQPVLTITSPIGTPQSVRGTWSAGTCKPTRPELPMCVESQEYSYGIDNTGTDWRWESACYEITLSNGVVLEFEQTTASQAGGVAWTSQLEEWAASIQQAADNAGLLWFAEPRFIDSADPTDLGGIDTLPGPPSGVIGQALYDEGMRWRYVNVQICPGQPVPVSAKLIEVKDQGAGRASPAVPYELTNTPAILGPIAKFWLCAECGDTPEWYTSDGVTPLEPGQIPNCWEPCGVLSSLPPPPERECVFKFSDGCDNNGQDVQANFTAGLVRRTTICLGEITATDYFIDTGVALDPHNLQGAFVDCATGEPIPDPVPECPIPDSVAHRCIITTEVRTVKWQASDFDPADLEPGQIAKSKVSLAVDDPVATIELVPCPGYTFTETSLGNWDVTWIWNGTQPAPKRLEARVTLPGGEVYTVKDRPDFATYSGGDGSTEAEFKGTGLVKELCYVNAANIYQNDAGEKIPQPEFCPDTDEPAAYIGKLWQFRYALEGARVKYWQPTAEGGTAVAHADIETIFTGPNLQHPNAPSHEGLVAVFSFSTATAGDLEAIGIDDRAETNGTDQLCLTGFVNLAEPVTLTDANSNTGERGMLAYQPCCAGAWEVLSIDNTDSTSAAGDNRAAFQPATIPAGLHAVAVYTSDLSAWQGLDLRDGNGDRLPTYADKPGYLPPVPVKCYPDGRLYNAATGARIVVGPFDRWCAPACCGVGTLTECE